MKQLIDIINEKLILSKQKINHPENEYFYHEALEDDYNTKFIDTTNKLQYSIDNCKTWNELQPNTKTPEINVGERIYFKGDGKKMKVTDDGIGTFNSNKKFNVGGNIMSLIYWDDFEDQRELLNNYQFKLLFYDNTNLISSKNLLLPAAKLTEQCYANMFDNATHLIDTPKLPATELNTECYMEMFKATNIKEAPELPASKLADGCYYYMFYWCDKLIKLPELHSTKLEKYCYYGMFRCCEKLTDISKFKLTADKLTECCYRFMFAECKSLTKAPELPATKLANGCYAWMFTGCSSLTKAPELPAKRLCQESYMHMFSFCEKLNEITMLATDNIQSYDCLDSWIVNVSSSGKFTKAKGADIQIGQNGIPAGWTVKEI